MKIKRILTYLLTMALVMSLLPADMVKAGSKKSITMTVGETKQLKLTNIPKGKTVKWSSNNKKVAQVTQKGKVKAKKAGKAKITAKLGKKKYICIVKVKEEKKKENIPETTTEQVPESEIIVEEDTTTETDTAAEEAFEQTTTDENTETEPVETKENLTETTEEAADKVTTEEITTEAEVTTEEMTTEDTATEKTTTDEPLPEKPVEAPIPSIVYQAHVEDIGWMAAVKDGATAGTTGQTKRLEGLKIVLKDDKGNSMIKYRAHVQGDGWQAWRTSGQEAGTTHQEKRMEGIQIQLTGAYAAKYDIYYRVHVAEYGWLGWAKNGEMAGSQGIALQMEAIEMKLVKKNQSFAVGGSPIVATPDITYQVHCADIGWMSEVDNRKIAGTTGQERQLEGIKINLLNTDGKNGIQYRAHVGEVGWQGWKTSGQLAGTTGQAKRMEAIEIKLAGDVANRFDIYYRVHVEDIGWLGWAKNGETAGTTGGARRAEAIQIQLVVKDAPVDREGAAYKKLNQTGYNASAALQYAASHWNDGQGLCAEFVSKCVQAGGLPIKTELITTNCYNAVSNYTGVQGQDLKLDANGYATKSLDGNILSAGDVVIQWCYTHTYRPHILICGGYDSNGYATFYAHNSAKNNERYRFNVTYSSQAPCTRNCNIGAKVLHISN